MALGDRIFVDWIDGWHEEPSAIGVNVNWVHTKFMLIDPLGSKPVTLTGSANWSEASVNDNDENMLVIRGDKRVADIYFGEFMRIFAHHRFRESVARHIEEFGSAAFNTWKPQDLFEDWRKWVPDALQAGFRDTTSSGGISRMSRGRAVREMGCAAPRATRRPITVSMVLSEE